LIKIGIDVGGTFTDSIAMDDVTGEFWTAKVPTTPKDPARGFMLALDKLVSKSNCSLEDVGFIIHGTTLITNAMIERKGGPIALITTEGFGDTLWIRTERRYDLFDLMIEFPEPLVERKFVVEVPERVLDSGRVLKPLNRHSVSSALASLDGRNIKSVAICLLHSDVNPRHERLIASLVRKANQSWQITLSSEVWAESGEYHRMSTAVANAYVQPLVDSYLGGLQRQLVNCGFQGKFFLMLSNGGTASLETGRLFPIQLIESGPAAGVMAATFFLEKIGIKNALSFDMGGTTAKLSLIEGGAPQQTDFLEVGRLKRHMPGSGIPIQIPVVDLLEIGSGGGSIARIDNMGLLKVGPESAGADPGPACYGWGGENPTVTDADLILGYLNPAYFLGGEMLLDIDAAKKAIERKIASRIGMSVLEAAWGVHNVVNQSMALGAKMHVLERGRDPTRFQLVSYGGAGPVHTYGVMRMLGIKKGIVPPSAGVAASLGFLSSPIAFDLVRSYRAPLKRIDWEALQTGFEELENRGSATLSEADVPNRSIRFIRAADMRFIGQGYEVSVPIPNGNFNISSESLVIKSFEEAYRSRYAHLPMENGKLEFVRLRVRAWTPVKIPELSSLPVSSQAPKVASLRPAYFEESHGYVRTPVYRWYSLTPGINVSGPAIIEAPDTTAVIGPAARFTLNDIGCLVIEMKGDSK
jgi:N-methylhydantoinase A/oxoprolinase/acetone carboxylase beta subunit